MCSNCGAAGIALRVIVAATLGGTVSKLSGGKFSNGARTSAFAQLFNNELNRQPKTLSLTSEEVEEIKSSIHDLIVDMEDKVGNAISESDIKLLSELLGVELHGNPFVDGSNIDAMVFSLTKTRQMNGIMFIRKWIKLRTEQGGSFIANALAPVKLGLIERAFNGVYSLYKAAPSQISNIKFYGQNTRWHSSFDKNGITYITDY